MTTGQKVIKAFGITLAIFIIVDIFALIVFSIASIFNLLDNDEVLETNKNLVVEDNYDIKSIDINLHYTKLIIKSGLELKAETNNNDITIKEDDRELIIEETKKNFFKNYDDYELIIYLPEDTIFDSIDIKAGAGKIEIMDLKCYSLSFDFGAGSAVINNLVVLDNTKIKGGAGAINIKNGSLNNLELKMGVGKFSLTSSLKGHSIINAGIGEMLINILGSMEDYTFKIDKGIGPIKVNSENVSKEEIIGNGKNCVEIDGGIGKIDIDFAISK